MSMQRHVPIITDHSRMYPADMDHFFRDSSFSNFRDVLPRDPTRDHYREVVREPAVYHHPSTSVMPLSRSFFNPERQLGTMDMDMQRMASEMRRMYQDMQHLMPVDANPDSWRKKENYLLDNPVYHDQSLGRELFRLQFDVRQFKPEEISVKTVGSNLTVHAKHEEKLEGKSLHREYHREYVLPKDMNPENLVSKLSRDGVLTIEAPLPVTDGNRLIAIKHE
uniref:SHSP domain-containing protein n=1 Tax=Arion vulgaris TaxID=1028688 RepID=A0A0B7A866_9EUPU